jgi:hypothetical protein
MWSFFMSRVFSTFVLTLWMSLSGLIVCTGTALGAEISIPALKGKAGNTIDVPVMIDRVSQLAGVKIVIQYDPDILHFKDGKKTKESQSFMHIVNDKKPGKLIIVMASAKGISGKDFPIVILTFGIKNSVSGNKVSRIDIVEVQLMSEQLQEIKCKPSGGSIAIHI